MPKGFFAKSTVSRAAPVSLVPKCGLCGLYKDCLTPKMEPTGRGREGVLIIAEAPGAEEDKAGTQLIGKAGQYLKKELRKIDVDLDRDCWKTNAIICRPPKNKTPTDEQVDACRPNIIKAVKEYEPRVIIPMGGVAVRSLLNWLWGEAAGSINRWVGYRIPNQNPDCWICPTFHPSYVMRKDTPKVAGLLFRRHLKTAFGLQGTPWAGDPPDYKKQVDIIYDTTKAARIIQKMQLRGGLVAFDYETNMLKPDHKKGYIVCASICWEGKKTIAFPFEDFARAALGDLLRGKETRKIAANLKFEDRWTKAKLGHFVRGWDWDTMQAAHVLDNRQGICGLKFQAFAQMGFPIYNAHIQPYLEAEGSYAENRIKEIDSDELLLYCGLDSLLEFKLSTEQKALL